MLKKSLKIAFLSVLLVGCTKAANLSVQALSSTLVQMKSTFANPFTQNYDTNKYAVFSGQCLNIITSLQISFNEGPWLNVPSSTAPLNGNQTINSVVYPYTETLTPLGTYDVDCSDGSFYFWIYSHQFDQMVFDSLGLTPSNSQVYKISIRGVSGSYATEPTVYNSPNSGAPSQLSLYKGGPAGAAANTCAYFTVSLEDANGKNAKYSSDIPFSLSHSINSTSDTPTFYSSNADCIINSPGTALSNSSLKVPAQQSEFYLFYNVSSSAIVGDVHNFSVSYGGSPISLGTAHGSLSMTIKANNTQYIDIAAPYQMVPNLCYPLKVDLRTYGGAFVNSSAETFNISSSLKW